MPRGIVDWERSVSCFPVHLDTGQRRLVKLGIVMALTAIDRGCVILGVSYIWIVIYSSEFIAAVAQGVRG